MQHLLQLHFQAELAEALLTRDLPKGKDASRMQTLVGKIEGLKPRMRKRMARRLMTRDISTGAPLAPRYAVHMRKIVRPGNAKPMRDRSGMIPTLGEILAPEKPFEEGDVKGCIAHLLDIAGDFHPALAQAYSDDLDDGRDPGAEPGDTDQPHEPADESTALEILQPELVPYERLDLIVERIVCLDTTNGEWGKDEISISGVAMEAALGNPIVAVNNPTTGPDPRVLPITPVGDYGNAEERVLSPEHLHARFDLTGQFRPYFVSVAFTMAETDPQGGFGSFMANLQDTFRLEMNEIIVSAFMFHWSPLFLGALGTAIGAGVGGPIGALIGAIAGAAVGTVAGVFFAYLLLGGNRDDVFEVNYHPPWC